MTSFYLRNDDVIDTAARYHVITTVTGSIASHHLGGPLCLLPGHREGGVESRFIVRFRSLQRRRRTWPSSGPSGRAARGVTAGAVMLAGWARRCRGGLGAWAGYQQTVACGNVALPPTVLRRGATVLLGKELVLGGGCQSLPVASASSDSPSVSFLRSGGAPTSGAAV